MIRVLSATLFLIAGFPAGVYVQKTSARDVNAAVEFYNNCTCVPQDRCDENNEIFTYDPSLIIEKRMKMEANANTKRILCQSESSSVQQYCCKQPSPDITTIKPADKNPETQNAILEVFYNCKCVSENRCNENNNIVSDDPSLAIQRRTSAGPNRIRCESASSEKLYCCKQPDNTDSTSTKPEVIDRGPVEVKCGKGISPLEPRILAKDDDETPADGEFPWMVAVFNKTPSGNYQFRCGGSLIHPKVVLTANHCVHRRRPNDFIVGANGKIALPKKNTERRRISEIIKHPKYTHFGRLYNDAALLFLEKPFPTEGDNAINTLCLPPDGLDLEDMNCYVAGWGNGPDGQGDQNMKKVQLPFIDHNRCQTLLRRTRLEQNFRLHNSFMCAGGEEGKDACIGDGGGPLMCEMPSEEERYFQAGIVSWGIGCGTEDVPGVYTDVEKITEWIKKELGQRNLLI